MYKKYEPYEEYGGYLPLELNPGKEMFSEYEEHLCRFNSVKAAFAYIIGLEKPSKVFIPYYYCPSTTEALKAIGIDVVFYHISSDLCPKEIVDKDGIAILLVDYFGVKTEAIQRMAEKYERATVIIDCAHSFFTKPIFCKNVYNVYSARKFFGVPDGAYAVAENILFDQKSPGTSVEYAEYLLKAYELGVNAAYLEKKSADRIIASRNTNMSKLSIGLLQNVDYRNVEIKRKSNYEALNQLLGHINELSIPEKCAAYQYPLLISNYGQKIKRNLVKNKIFVSTLWNGKDLMDNANDFERNMSDNAVFLPIDQRYDIDDMRYLAETVLEIRKIL